MIQPYTRSSFWRLSYNKLPTEMTELLKICLNKVMHCKNTQINVHFHQKQSQLFPNYSFCLAINILMSILSSRKATRSLPPLPKQHSYIQRTLQLFDSGCYKGNALNIDGDMGDYRMRLFRTKDKKEYARKIQSVFTNSFTDSILPKEPHNEDVKELITNIIKKPYRNSITPQPQVIAAKDQLQHEGPRLGKGYFNGLMEEDEYLLYGYLPEYQRKRWFQVKDKSPALPQLVERTESMISVKKNTQSRKSSKIRHIFAYLEDPLYLRTIK